MHTVRFLIIRRFLKLLNARAFLLPYISKRLEIELFSLNDILCLPLESYKKLY